MQVIDQINGSALFAQSAYSASIATKDNLGRDITSTYLTSHQDISNLMPKSESANFYPMTGNPSGFLTAHQDLSDYQTIDGMTAYQPTGNYATESFVENVSGEITALIPTDYATETLVEETSGAITSLIPTNYYPDSNPSSFATEDWVTAQGYITGVNISESAKWEEATTTVQTNSSNWDNVSNKLDTTAFSTISGDFLVASSLNGYATESFVETISGDITALIPDTSNFITNSSAEVTYQTIDGMTAYQPVGSYATTNELEQVSGDITTLIPSTAGLASESYVQTNSAVLTGMIDAKQDTLTFGYDGQDKISAINNSAIVGGAAFDVFPISGTGAVDVYEQNSVLWVSGKDFTSDISYISGTIGDVETLLASL